jgi:uncharacterized protein (TIGR02594 family)
MARAIDVVRKVTIKPRPNYITAIEQGDSFFKQHDMVSPARLSHFLAQILHESGGLKVEWENKNYSAKRMLEIFGVGKHSAGVTPEEALKLAGNPEAIAERIYGLGNPKKAAALGNIEPGDGFHYRGGGLMQTTGRFNYRKMGEKCGVEFEKNPEEIVSAEHALKPALAEWTAQNLNSFADANDILSISRAINFGNPRIPRTPNGMQSRMTWFARVQPLLGRVDFECGGPAPLPQPGTAKTTLASLVGERFYQVGNESSVVRAIQLTLAKLGYPLRGTGYFGGRTDTAVTDFQRLHNIEADGVVGPETAKELDRAGAEIEGSGSSAQSKKPGEKATKGDSNKLAEASGRPLWVIEGLKWLDTHEVEGTGDNPDILNWARGEGGQIEKYYKKDSVPWCALYANMVLSKVGIKGTETLWALDWNKWGTRLGGPAVGAFAPMKRKGGGRIAIVVGRDQHRNLMCLGGNQDDAVNIRPFPKDRPLSFRWPSVEPLPANVGFNKLPIINSDGRLSKHEG